VYSNITKSRQFRPMLSSQEGKIVLGKRDKLVCLLFYLIKILLTVILNWNLIVYISTGYLLKENVIFWLRAPYLTSTISPIWAILLVVCYQLMYLLATADCVSFLCIVTNNSNSNYKFLQETTTRCIFAEQTSMEQLLKLKLWKKV
jgi:hypothetical protein